MVRTRVVIIFPDADAFQDWTAKSSQLTFSKAAIISDYIYQSATSPTCDLSDYLIPELQNQSADNEVINNEVVNNKRRQVSHHSTNLQTLLNINPALQILIDTLNPYELPQPNNS